MQLGGKVRAPFTRPGWMWQAVAISAWALALAGNIQAVDQLVLGVANDSGRKTRLAVANRSSSSAQVRLTFITGSEGLAVDPFETTIAPDGTAVWGDALAEMWSLSGQRGALKISSDQPVLITATKHLETPDGGWVGSPLPVLAEDQLLKPRAIGDLIWLTQSADPGAGLTSSIDVYLADAGAGAEITIYDRDGNPLGSQTVTDGPKLLRIPVASLVGGELKVGRAEVRATTGRVTAALDVLDPTTGHLTTSLLMTDRNQDRDFTLVSAFHRTNLGNTRLRTDIRLFNPNPVENRVVLTLGSSARALTLNPRGLVEISDILSEYGAEDGAQGRIQFQSAEPMLMMARDAATNPLADPAVEYNEIHAIPRTDPLLTQGQTATVGGLRGGSVQTLLNFRAGTNAANADLTLKDAAGQILGTSNLVLERIQSRLLSLADLLPGVTATDDAILEIALKSGSLDIEMFRLDGTTGDVDYVQAQPSVGDLQCARPQISFIDATERNLARAGDVTFTWETGLTDTVALAPGATGLPSRGVRTLHVESSTVFQFIARNSCGEISVPIGVSVGAPSLQSLSYLTPAGSPASEGQPGQLFTISLRNVGDASKLKKLILREGTRLEMELPIAGFSREGTPFARVPLLADPAAPGGYRSGTFSLTAVVGDRETPAISLNVQRLPSVSDPVTEFRAILDGVSAAAQKSTAGLRAASASSEALEAARSIAARIETDLRGMASAIAASGRTSLTHGLRASAPSSAPSVVVTRDDLAALLALNRNYLTSRTARPVSPPAEKSASGQRQAGTCIQDRQPYLSTCKALEDAVNALWRITDAQPQVFTVQELDTAFGQNTTAVVTLVSGKLRDSAVQGVVRKMNLWLSWVQALCDLQTIRLKRFDLSQSDFPVGLTVGFELRAVLEPKYKSADEVSSGLVSDEVLRILNQIPAKYANIKPSLEFALKPVVQQLNGDEDRESAAFIQKYASSIRSEQAYQVGKCDVSNFYAARNGPDEQSYSLRTSIFVPVYATNPAWGNDYYYLKRNQEGTEALCISHYDHFPLSKAVLDDSLRYPRPGGRPCESAAAGQASTRTLAGGKSEGGFDFLDHLFPNVIYVVDGRSQMIVTGSQVNAWCVCSDESPTGILSPGDQFQGSYNVSALPDPYRQSRKYRDSQASVLVRNEISFDGLSKGREVYRVELAMNTLQTFVQNRNNFHDAIARVGLRFTNKRNRSDFQTIGIDIQVSPGCQRPATYTGVVGDFSVVGTPPRNPFVPYKHYFVGQNRGQMNFSIGGEIATAPGQNGFPSVTTNCTMTAIFEMLDGPPPPQQ